MKTLRVNYTDGRSKEVELPEYLSNRLGMKIRENLPLRLEGDELRVDNAMKLIKVIHEGLGKHFLGDDYDEVTLDTIDRLAQLYYDQLIPSVKKNVGNSKR